MTQYEYKIISGKCIAFRGSAGIPTMPKLGRSINWSDVEKRINNFVTEGWEVVSSNTSSYGLLIFGCGTQEPLTTFVLRKSHQS